MSYHSALEKFKEDIVSKGKGSFKNHISSVGRSGTPFGLSNHAIFKDAVEAAYLDAARTFRDISKRNNGKTTALANLAMAIQKYFSAASAPTTEKDFDTFHSNLCNRLIGDFKPYTIQYGQAQKIVNMTFKYLYCLGGAATSFSKYFEHCHVALDSFTLEWIWRNCDTKKHNKYEAWSTLQENTYSSKNTTRPGYKDILDIYRNHTNEICAKYPSITPFQAEFIFWPEIQMELSAEAFLKQLEEDMDSAHKKNIEKMKLSEKLKEIIKKAVDFI